MGRFRLRELDDVLRKALKVEKPFALGWDEWDEWYAELKKNRPVAYFLTETVPDAVRAVARNTIGRWDDAIIYLSNRLHGSHYLHSTLPKGKYHEFETRMLHSLFDSFVDFIEIEEASHHIAWNDDKNEYKQKWYHRIWLVRRLLPWRCAKAGIDHLKWEMTLDVPPDPPDPNWSCNPHQAVSAREKMELYTWWKHVRPKRGAVS